MATRKSNTKPQLKPVKAKESKKAATKKPAKMPAPVPTDSQSAKEAILVPASSMKQKIKLVRDSFTIPKNEYLTLSHLKLRSARLGREAKKSEVLRAGIEALRAMSDEVFSTALEAIPSLKTGRPKDSKKSSVKKTTKKK